MGPARVGRLRHRLWGHQEGRWPAHKPLAPLALHGALAFPVGDLVSSQRLSSQTPHRHPYPYPDPKPNPLSAPSPNVAQVTRVLCKELNEHFLCPTNSDAMKIEVGETQVTPSTPHSPHSSAKCMVGSSCMTCGRWVGLLCQVEIHCEDGAYFSFPKVRRLSI